MKEADEIRRGIEALRERLFKLSEASLRISESLELKTVLREVLESARALTGARTVLIVTVDSSGNFEDFTTCGLTSRERQWFREMPLGPRLCEYMQEVGSRPVRMKDMSAHLRSVGFPQDPLVLRTFLSTPIRHQAKRVGSFYLGDKLTGEEFTSEDGEILNMFSFQAGAAIANARKHRDEQQARADLEALIDLSPVGVIVFDAQTIQIASHNREAVRIAERLRTPGQSDEQLLESVALRHADARERTSDNCPIVQAVREARTVRAVEMVLEVPGGRKVATLINASPIRSGDGEIESVLVTLQDMTPLAELERLRAEFIGQVSHELHAPLTSIKGCAASALDDFQAPGPAETQQYFRIIDEQADHMRTLIGDLMDVTRIETGTLSVAPKLEELATIVDQARNTFLSGGGSNPVHIDLPPDLPPVMADRQRVAQVLGNLLANARQHSPESSPIRLTATLQGVHMAISVTDKGKGIAKERLPYLFRKFVRSGREERARRIGAGLGLAICKGLVEAHGGRIWAESHGPELGARFTFTIPTIEAGSAKVGASSGRRSPQRRPVPAKRRVLVVDDDPQALAYARRILEGAGYGPLLTGNTSEISDLLVREQPDLVLLDLMLSGTDGIELMKAIPALADRPIIFVSAYGRDETIARALQAGAADYIVKPFSPIELLARIQVALRAQAASAGPYRAGDLAVDYEYRRVEIAGRTVRLTATEYNLLRALAENAGRVSTYDYLLRRVWGRDNRDDTRTVRAFIRNLRRKLGDDAKEPRYIFTEPRVGYRMAEQE